jgi:hypothetical protein
MIARSVGRSVGRSIGAGGFAVAGGGGPTYLLDTYTGAAAAYSLRRLNSAYTGPVVQVRRSGDSAEDTFSATEVGDGTLAAWVTAGGGTEDGFVKTWYDQSGNGNDASQATAGNQPQIVASGAVVLENGKAVVSCNGTSQFFTRSTFSVNGFVFFAAKGLVGGVPFQGLTTSLVVSNTGSTVWSLRKVADATVAIDSTASYFARSVVTFKTLENNCEIFVNGTSEGTDNTTNPFGSSDTELFRRVGSYFKGVSHEIIIYSSDQSSNRTGIESNIASHYGITLS